MLQTKVNSLEFDSLQLEETHLNSAKKVLYLISFFPFIYKRHPFCYTMFYANETYVLLTKELKAGSKECLSIHSLKKNGRDITLEWDYCATKTGKTVKVRNKTFTYDLIKLNHAPVRGFNVDAKRVPVSNER
ncbi:hypothetical protein JOC95_000454 [Bacillus tianshenii]|uniref:Uncharacterized protein n=1 Tax=Sutcliffiella tianshenii TaxID=1463404 RepID=A0ABS2NVB9_9BACI|nr:hypothetical protein [Bacillus tianshenii]MBM7618612.1 hypothetical protein [Bacillus tianshenii]